MTPIDRRPVTARWSPRAGSWTALALTLTLVGLPGAGRAQGNGDEGNGAGEDAPQVRVVGFTDRSTAQNCDPLDSRHGRCIEEVDFAPAGDAWAPDRGSPGDMARWTNLGVLYAQTWEDLAHRWSVKGDVLELTMHAARIRSLPSAPVAWEASTRHGRLTHSLPGPELWLDGASWVDQGTPANNLQSFFRSVRYLTPQGQAARPDTILLSGRFALRLGFAGRRHDFDLMNGDRKSSGPFFEQMYPYSQALQRADESVVPLAKFDREVPWVPRAGGYPVVREQAIREFHGFSSLLASQVAQFALEDYTINHMRVLTALTAMQSPPGAMEERTGRTGDLVAAALGETDSSEEARARIGDTIIAVQRGFEINYFQLPMPIVDAYLPELISWGDLSQGFYDEFNAIVLNDLEDLLRPIATELTSLDPALMRDWVIQFANPGVSAEMVLEQLKRSAISLLVDRLDQDARDELQTRILLDHVNLEITSTFDATPGVKVPPKDLLDASSGSWESVLAKHGYRPQPFPQGLGAVDPTSICTTLDGQEALDEEVFGSVNLDLLFAGEDRAKVDEDVIWAARDAIPFLMVDNPEVTAPTVERLVGLPGGRALYRARWELWSGWHLFWNAVPATDDPEHTSLLLRTGAVCSDTVLAEPHLVPTLARAALLDANLRPTTPVLKADEERWKRLRRASADDVIDGAAAVGDTAQEGAAAAEGVAGAVGDDPSAALAEVEVSADSLGALLGQGPAVVRVELNDVTRYIREVMRPPVRSLAQQVGPTVLVVFDTTGSVDRYPLGDRRPRTPYARRQLRVRRPDDGADRFVRSAAWGLFVPDSPGLPIEQVTPSHRPTESVNPNSWMPRWGRARTTDFTLVTGLGFLPLRYVEASCTEGFENDDPSTVFCTEAPRYHEGFSIDVGAMATWWIVDDRRLAIEIGGQAQLDVHPAGPTRLWGDYDDTINAWTFRPAFGAVFGLRGAPNPAPLRTILRRPLPWGAENANGATVLNRFQMGFRGGFLLGPGFNGVEGTAFAEVWWGGSIRGKRGKWSSFTPYHPALIIGPYLRGQYEFVIAEDEPRLKRLDQGLTAIVGIRLNIHLRGAVPEVPEGS